MSNLIFNLRVWKFHIQITCNWRVIPVIKWYDCWVGLYFDERDESTYFFPIPMLGLKLEGIVVKHNPSYFFKKHPFIWLFNFGANYYPMREENAD